MASVAQKHPMEWLARAGYASRGIVYVIIGWLAFAAAIGSGGETTDSKGALERIMTQPFGKILLAIVVVGLIGYVAWRLTQALRDTDDHGTDPKGLVVRGALLVSSVTHTLLAIFALRLIFNLGGGSSDSGSGTEDWTAMLLAQPFGRWLVVGVGALVIGAGVAHIWKGWHAKFEKHLQWDSDVSRIGQPICRFGLIARGLVFLIVGGFLMVAAWQSDADEARGLNGALQTLQEQSYGWILLSIVAIGLVAFGLYSLIEAVYRKVEPKG